MLDDAIVRGKQTPFAYVINEKLTRPRSAITRMYPAVRQKGQIMKDARGKPLKKDKDRPAPGQYNNLEAEEKMRCMRQ